MLGSKPTPSPAGTGPGAPSPGTEGPLFRSPAKTGRLVFLTGFAYAFIWLWRLTRAIDKLRFENVPPISRKTHPPARAGVILLSIGYGGIVTFGILFFGATRHQAWADLYPVTMGTLYFFAAQAVLGTFGGLFAMVKAAARSAKRLSEIQHHLGRPDPLDTKDLLAVAMIPMRGPEMAIQRIQQAFCDVANSPARSAPGSTG